MNCLHATARIAVLTIGIAASPLARAEEPAGSWPELRDTLYGSKPIAQSDGVVALDAPPRAPDPATVPVTLHLDPARDIRRLTLIVDENPAPVAATFEIGDGARIESIETRIRVNAYSNVRIVAETADGQLHQAVRYVKASGGCAAPAARDPAESARTLGEMRLRRLIDAADGPSREAQLMIRHPNNSGLQRDQITHLYIPAHFVSDLRILLDGKPFLSMSGGISISEDPNFRFRYAGADGTFTVTADDTDGRTFARSFTPGAS